MLELRYKVHPQSGTLLWEYIFFVNVPNFVMGRSNPHLRTPPYTSIHLRISSPQLEPGARIANKGFK